MATFVAILASLTNADIALTQERVAAALELCDDLDKNMKATLAKKVIQATWTAEQYAAYRASSYAAGREKAKETRANTKKRPRLTPEERLKLAEGDLRFTLSQAEKAKEYVEELREKLT